MACTWRQWLGGDWYQSHVVLSERADSTRVLPTEEVSDNRQGINTLYNTGKRNTGPSNVSRYTGNWFTRADILARKLPR